MTIIRNYGFTGLTGEGAGALDRIPLSGGPTLVDGDMAYGIVSDKFHAYKYSSASTATEASPYIISPSDAVGRWELIHMDYEVDALLCYGESTNYTQATIEAALTAIGTTNKVTLLLRPGTWVISSNADWSAYTNVTFKVVPGAKFSGAFTLNIPNIEAGLYQIFDSTLGVVTLSGNIKEVYPEWWGADPKGAVTSKTAFNNMFSSGAKLMKAAPGATYLLKDVVLPETSNFVFDGNNATFIADGTVGVPATSVFSVTYDSAKCYNYTIKNLKFSTDGATKGYATDLVKITQEGTGYGAYLYVTDIEVTGGGGTSIVKYVLNNTSVPEVMHFKRITGTDTQSYQYMVNIVKGATAPTSGIGSSAFEDIYQSSSADGTYSAVKANVTIERSRFENIYSSGGAAFEGVATGVNPTSSESTRHCQFKNIYNEAYYDASRPIKGFFSDCSFDGLYLLEIAGTGSELFNGAMASCNLRNLTHVSRTGSYSVEFSADAQHNYVHDLYDYLTYTNNWPLISNLGTDNSFGPNGIEAAWTAGITCGTSGTITLDNSYKSLSYTRKGNLVTFSGLLVVDSVSSPVGTATINLPFTAANNTRFSAAVAIAVSWLEAAATTAMQAYIDGNTKVIMIQSFAAGVATAAAPLFKTGSTIRLSGSYLAKPDGT